MIPYSSVRHSKSNKIAIEREEAERSLKPEKKKTTSSDVICWLSDAKLDFINRSDTAMIHCIHPVFSFEYTAEGLPKS